MLIRPVLLGLGTAALFVVGSAVIDTVDAERVVLAVVLGSVATAAELLRRRKGRRSSTRSTPGEQGHTQGEQHRLWTG